LPYGYKNKNHRQDDYRDHNKKYAPAYFVSIIRHYRESINAKFYQAPACKPAPESKQ
jgi:hypothetical protein